MMRTPIEPPRLAVRMLGRILNEDRAGTTILGDLHEDFARMHRERGPGTARRWYWGQALALGVARVLRRTLAVRPLRDELRHAARSVRRNPGFTVFTAAMIALGVAAATTIYSVLRPLILAPLPFEDPQQLIWISNDAPEGDNSLESLTSRTANLYDFRERARSFRGITAYNAMFPYEYTLTGKGEPERVEGVGVAHDFLDVLGVSPIRGRGFTAEEGMPKGPPAVILSYGYWQRRFGVDPDVVGRTLVLSDVAHTVTGVLPPTFDFSSTFAPGRDVDVLVPFPIFPAGRRGYQGNMIFMIGRLRPGASAAAAQAELDGILADLGRTQPERFGLGAKVTPLQAHIAGPFRTLLILLATAASTLLLIVCVNVSNLMLARSPKRAREMAVRKAMGASGGRLVRQLLLESVVIALAGAAMGAVLAFAVVRAVAGSAAIEMPLLDRAAVDTSALLVATALAMFTGVAAGLVPALHVADGAEAVALRSGTTGGSHSRRARRTREAFVIVQVALACVLLVISGLLVRSFTAVLDIDLGFDPMNVVAWQLNPGTTFDTPRERSDFYAALTSRIERVPGVEHVGLIDVLPLGRNRSWPYRIVGEPEEEEADRNAFPHVIDPGYLAALRVPLIAGRNFTDGDTGDSPPVVLINETAARRMFPDSKALGRRLHFWGSWDWEIVGIVKDVRHVSPEMDAGIEVYFPIAQMPDFGTVDLAVRSSLSTGSLVDAVAAALREMDTAMPIREFRTMRATVDRSTSARRFTLQVLAAYGLAALFLAAVGLYGMLAHSVAERRGEISVRMALGASSNEIGRDILGRTLRLTCAGVAIGAVLALATARLLGSLLFGVGPADPITFATMTVVLLVVAAIAGALPAARAVRVSVLEAIRSE